MLRPLVPALRTQLKRTVTTSGGDIIATVYGTEWPVRLGRLDAPAPGPGRVPAADAPVPEIVAFMKQLGAKPGVLRRRAAPRAAWRVRTCALRVLCACAAAVLQ